jgi:hypothetical protein
MGINAGRCSKNGRQRWKAKAMIAPITHILALTTVVRTRMLPTEGRIIARLGQKVTSTDVVGDAIVGRKYVIVDFAQGLNLPPQKAASFLKAKKGQKVSRKEILAGTTGMFSRVVEAPAEGRIVAIGGGKLVLETGGSVFELVAGIPGVISEVINERGVVIRATGAIVQGLYGNGRLETGVMLSMFEKPDDIFTNTNMDVNLRGSIIVAGHVNNPAVIKNAAELPLRGMILASISPAVLAAVTQAPFPILVTDGFGQRPMNSAAFKLLTTNVKREVTLNAESYDSQNGTRPEIFIPLPVTQEPPEPRDTETFAPGQTVRVCYLAHPSLIGTVVQLRPGLSALPSGLNALAAEIRLETGEQVLVPLTNLEVLG